MSTSSSNNAQSMTTVKTTRYNVQTSGASGGSSLGFRGPIASPKTVVINRTLPGVAAARDLLDASSTMRSVNISRSFSGGGGGRSGAAVAADVSSMLTGREKEKRDMQELNERLAGYIEKVRFLEAQNKKLSNELQQLKDRWGKETEKIKLTYETELQQLRKLLEDAEKHKAEAEVRISSLEDQLNELQVLLDEANRLHQVDRETIDKLNQQMADYDGEISLLRRRVAAFDEERARDQREIKRLRDDVSRLRTDLDTETLNHINAENAAQSLREELDFLKQVHESELKELAILAYRDTTNENREFWRNEMSQALHDIQREYEVKLDSMRSEIEAQYRGSNHEHKGQPRAGPPARGEQAHKGPDDRRPEPDPELEARNAQLERELEELRREMEEAERECEMTKSQLRADLASSNATLEEYMRELQVLMDAKLSLELEIHAYRKLLEGEEVRINQRAQETITQRSSTVEKTSVSVEQQQLPSPAVNLVKGEMSAKTTYQRTAKGNVSIQECSPDGKFVLLENTGKKVKEDIGGWKLSRNIDNNRQTVRYTVPMGTVLDDGQRKTVKIWARGHRPLGSGSGDLEAGEPSWGVGANIVTSLYNMEGEERATHNQKTVYSAN
uniref:IF rod domain-containing protein n=1 Tax=Macrostomum lignano TaxID=282301 RepID=A0A1I8ITN1_9PLAT